MKHVLLTVILALSAFTFTGCDVDLDKNPVAGFLYEEVGGSYAVTDQFNNSITFNPSQAEQIAALGEGAAVTYLSAKFRAEFPEDYQDPKTQVTTTTESIQGDIETSNTAEGVLGAVRLVPVWGDVAALGLNGLLAIGAIWLNKKRKTSDSVSRSLVQGIDTFRDILDQTNQGDVIDAKLVEVLKDKQVELNVIKSVNKLLDRYATPTKKAIDLD